MMSSATMHYLPTLDRTSLEQQLASWQAAQPRMGVFALLPEAEHDSVALLQDACARLKVPLAGALFPALVEGGEFRTQGAWILRFDEMPHAKLYSDLPTESDRILGAVDSIVADITPMLGEQRDITLFMLFDAMVPNISTILDQLYLRLANRVHYMGANAGSESFQPMPCLFDGSRIIQGGVLIVLLQPHLGAVLEHGYGAPPQTLQATSTEGNRIVQIDWRPAFEVYQEMAREHYGVEITPQNFYQMAVHFPVGIVRANGTILVRIPVTLEADGSLFCVGEVPPNALLTLLSAPAVNSAQTLDALLHGLTVLGAAPEGRDVLLFYCAGRRLHLGVEAARDELRQFVQRSHAGQIAGALSLGEVGASTQWDYPLFHNATLVASYWGRSNE